jgi:uncharacterized protein YndB with AHSA1/START domain
MKTIHHVIDLDAPRSKVWWALTDRDGLTGWWSTRLEASPAAVGVRLNWTFAGDFNPIMEITMLEPEAELWWRCVAGHDNWSENTFRFQIEPLGRERTRLRFWQEYSVELADDDYGTYNFNWGYYLESLRLLCTAGQGRPYDPLGS